MSAASGTSFFGWNLLYNSVAKDIKSNQDVIFCLTHYVLTSNGFECIGIGDSKNMDGNEPKSEALPDGWNDNHQLRYVYQGRLYLLQGTSLDDGIMLNLIRVDERTTSMIQINNRAVLRRSGTIDDMIPSNRDIVKQIKENLINKVVVSSKVKDNGTQTVSTSHENVPSQHSPNNSPQFPNWPGLIEPTRSLPRVQDPFGIGGLGRNDLDPLAGIGGPRFGGIPGIQPGNFNPMGGGGMLFQPPGRADGQPAGIPPGGLPPGARFDPFRPPDVDGVPPRRPPNRPDNDELPPPGFDDMYM